MPCHPVHEVFQLARENGMEGRVRVIACGAGVNQLSDIQLTFEDCVQSGYWLVIHNVHLIGKWNKPLLNLIKVS
jgi:ferredoxin-like protein FixX